MIRKQNLTKEQALQKLRHYCAWQDRCHDEVKTKAYSLGLKKPEVEEALAVLIGEDFLNEERFAKKFAGGKFRMKQWGRVKIKQALKQKRISAYCISAAMQEIDEAEYEKIIRLLARKKWDSVKGAGANHFVKMSKTRDFLLQRGFEAALVISVIKELNTGSA